jgi:hypothetical protein
MATGRKIGKTSGKKIFSRRTKSRKSPIQANAESLSTVVTTDDVILELQELLDSLGLGKNNLPRRKRAALTERSPSTRTPHPATVLANLMTVWNQDPEYLDRFGSPIPIRLRGTKRSFTSLARRCAPNIHPSKTLGDLKRLKAVRVDKSGLIHSQSRSISVFDDRQLAVQHTLATLHGFIGTLRHNLEDASTNSHQLFHRIAWNHKFDSRDLPRFQIWLRNHGQHFLELADNWMARNSEKSIKMNRHRRKLVQVTVGMYLAKDSNLQRASR